MSTQIIKKIVEKAASLRATRAHHQGMLIWKYFSLIMSLLWMFS